VAPSPWGSRIGHVPSATAILDRFLHHAETVAITGKSYRLRNKTEPAEAEQHASKPATMHAGKTRRKKSEESSAAETDDESQPVDACQA
jgi:hypothetical protein